MRLQRKWREVEGGTDRWGRGVSERERGKAAGGFSWAGPVLGRPSGYLFSFFCSDSFFYFLFSVFVLLEKAKLA
jgi:hypothetical protein